MNGFVRFPCKVATSEAVEEATRLSEVLDQEIEPEYEVKSEVCVNMEYVVRVMPYPADGDETAIYFTDGDSVVVNMPYAKVLERMETA